MPHTGFACPGCNAQGRKAPLMSNPGKFGYACDAGHVYEVDTEQLLAMNLERLAPPTAVKKPREGLGQLTLAVPTKLIDVLRDRFKGQLDATLEGVLISLLDPGAFIVTGFDSDKLKQAEFLGKKVTGSDHLLGLIYAIREERDEAKKEAELYKANSNGPGASATAVPANDIAGDFVQMTLRVSVEDFLAIKDKAKFNGKLPAPYVAEVIATGLLNGWF